MNPRVSVLIVSWNQADLLASCLTSVRAAHPTLPITVVDNGSTPALPPTPDVTWIRSETNLGFAGGNNLGLSQCPGDYVLLLNNDALLPGPQPLQTLVHFLDTHPHVAVAQAKLRLPDGTLDTCGEFLTPRGVLYHHGYCQPDGPHAESAFPIYAAKAACCLIRKSALADVGGLLFRDDYFCYGEDLELCHRLWLAGHEVWFVPTEPVLHAERATSKTLPSRLVWHHYLSNLLTTACDYWSWRTWCRLGPGFLLLLLCGSLLKGVLPRRKKHSIHFTRQCADCDFLPRVTVQVPWRYLIACHRRDFRNTCFPLPQAPKNKRKNGN